MKGEAEKNPQASGRTLALLAAALFLLAAAVYMNTLWNGFVYDDHGVVQANPWIKDLSLLKNAFTSSVWSFMETANTSDYYRPLMHVFYYFIYHIFGFRAWGWHLSNVLLHCVNTSLVFFLALELTGRHVKAAVAAAFTGALFFAWHPVNSEAVNWISSVTDLLYALFFLLSLLLYIRSEARGALYILSVLAFFIGTFAKEPAVLLPAVLVAYDFSTDRLDFKAAVRYLPYLAAGLFYIFLRHRALAGMAMPLYIFNPFLQFLTILTIPALYIMKIILPYRLAPFIPTDWVGSPASSTFLLQAALTVAFAILLAAAIRYSRKVLLPAALMIIPIAPTIYLVFYNQNAYNSTFIAERYLYLPMAGVSLGLVLVLKRVFEKPAYLRPVAAFMTVILGLYMFRTAMRNREWKDDLTLWKRAAVDFPTNYFAHLQIGQLYHDEKRLEEAEREYRTAIRLRPAFTGSHHSLGLLLYSHKKLDEAMAEFRKVLRINPVNGDALYNVALIHMDRNEWQEALKYLQRARKVSRGKRLQPILNALAVTYSKFGRLDKTKAMLDEAYAIDPADEETLTNIKYLKEYLESRNRG